MERTSPCAAKSASELGSSLVVVVVRTVVAQGASWPPGRLSFRLRANPAQLFPVLA
jgi:hypothetical protein